MARLNEVALRRLIKGGETTTVEFKVATPRPVEMAERLCGMANAQGGIIIIGVEDVERKAAMEDIDLEKVEAYLRQRSMRSRQAHYSGTSRSEGGGKSIMKSKKDVCYFTWDCKAVAACSRTEIVRHSV